MTLAIEHPAEGSRLAAAPPTNVANRSYTRDAAPGTNRKRSASLRVSGDSNTLGLLAGGSEFPNTVESFVRRLKDAVNLPNVIKLIAKHDHKFRREPRRKASMDSTPNDSSCSVATSDTSARIASLQRTGIGRSYEHRGQNAA